MPINDVLIKDEKFGDEASLIERYKPPHELPPPKLNLKMRKSDIRIVDRIASQASTPQVKTTRSQILNDLVEEVLLNMLNEMFDKDRHCAYLLARVADTKSGQGHGPLSGWSARLFADDKNYAYYWDQELPSAEANNGLSKEYQELAARLLTQGE